jgi:hypothetical protein
MKRIIERFGEMVVVGCLVVSTLSVLGICYYCYDVLAKIRREEKIQVNHSRLRTKGSPDTTREGYDNE